MPTKVAYLDCPTGISGDMCLGALVHAGVPLEYLAAQLGRLGIAAEFRLRAELVHRNGQQATKVHVDLTSEEQPNVGLAAGASQSHTNPLHPEHQPDPHQGHHHHHQTHSPDHKHSPAPPPARHSRHLPEIEQMILAAGLPDRATQTSLAVFRRLAEAEGAVHGISPEQVHFHEVGATDAIVDIVGTCLGLDWLGIEQLFCSVLPVGGGTVWAAHGHLPVPPPAVLKLWELRQVPIYSNGIAKELVTPTGAAIVTTLATQFGAPPAMLLQKVGLGAGSKDLPIPNILRLWIGAAETNFEHSSSLVGQSQPVAKQPVTAVAPTEQETVAILETQIDDLNPQAIGYVMAELLTAGALDVFTQAIGMKKSRPGVLLTVICHPEQAATCEAMLFRETTTLGIRCSYQQRSVLQREFETVATPYGQVQIKVARQPEGTLSNVQPEYEDCVKLAQEHHLPWREVHRLALQAWYEQQKSES